MVFRFLLIEDDEDLAKTTGNFLEELATVTICDDGMTGLEEAKRDTYDLIILDIMLPKVNGFQVLKRLRREKNFTPVLLLTAKDQLEDKVEGYQAGADDYLTKPFFREELLLRIRAILKRTKDLSEAQKIEVGQLAAHLPTRQVTFQSQPIELLGKEFDLLVYLMQNQGQILTKEQIFDRIWGFQSLTALSVVEVYMSNLRKKLRSVGYTGEIKTLRNIGYQFVTKE